MAISPDGKQIVFGSDDNSVRAWDAVTGTGTSTLQGHSNWVTSVAISPDGKQIVSGLYNASWIYMNLIFCVLKIRVWNFFKKNVVFVTNICKNKI